MPKYIAPLNPPNPVRPLENTRDQKAELFLHDVWSMERVRNYGTEVDFYSLDKASTTKDPVYGEPIERAFKGPYRILCHVDYPAQNPSPDLAGLVYVWPSGAWIPRKALELVKARPPKEGDVIRFWNNPYFNEQSVNSADVPVKGYFFTVTKVNETGHLGDTPLFVGYSTELTRRTEYTPEDQFDLPENGEKPENC